MELKVVVEETSIDTDNETEISLGEFSPQGLNPQDFLKIVSSDIKHSAFEDIDNRPVFYEIIPSLPYEEILKAIASAIRDGAFNIIITRRNYDKLSDTSKQLFRQK